MNTSTTDTTTANRLLYYAAAGYPAVAVETVEEERLIAAIRDGLATPPDTQRNTMLVASATGVVDLLTGERTPPSYPAAIASATQKDNALVIFLDWQHVGRNAGAYRALRDALPMLRARGSMVVLVAPSWSLPAELEHEVPVIRWALPTRDELQDAVEVVAKSSGIETIEALTPVLDACAGLTLAEAEGAAALAVAEAGTIAPTIVQREKLRLVRSTGYLEVWEPCPLEDLGGLGELRGYVEEEVVPSIHDRTLAVRGILLVGVPGTGKSLAVRAIAAALQWPAIRLDVGACKGSLVGETERRLRDGLARVEALSPCVLVLDEIEKAVGGYASSAQTDSGTTLGMVGALLTWLQEHKSPVITVATCNDYSALPPELTRAGRFDERFFVDLPVPGERIEIAAVHLRKYGCEPDGHAERIADLSEGWTGAEIEQLVRSAARRTRRAITQEAIFEASKDIKPISKVRSGEIEALRTWARNSVRIANSPATLNAPANERRVVKVRR